MGNATKTKKTIGKIGWIWITVCASILLASSVAVYAWFLKNYETPGTKVTTGSISLSLQSYKIDAATGAFVRYLNCDDTQVANSNEIYDALQKDVGMFASSGTTDDVYFVIQKKDGCIPIDVRLAFSVVGLKNHAQYVVSAEEDLQGLKVTYVGGFYYQLTEVTNAVAPLVSNATTAVGTVKDLHEDGIGFDTRTGTAITNIEQGLYTYATAAANATNSGTPRNLNSISAMNIENETQTLRDADYCVYRLTTGINDGADEAVCVGGSSFNIQLKLVAAQKDGFLSHGTSQTYYVANEAQLKSALSSYAPGDSITLTNNIVFNGDLILTKPVNLYLNNNGGYRLTVQGNFIITYPYNDTFTINTQNEGQIIVKKVNSGEGIFRVDLPLGNLVLTGAGDEAVTKADYYVESSIFWKASCIPVTSYSAGTTGYGITLDRALIRTGTGESDQEQLLHPIRLGDDTELYVSANTKVGKIYANHTEETVERIVIINYGTIEEQIDLSGMTVVEESQPYSKYRDDEHCPQIFINNYGTIASNGTAKEIILPYTAFPFSSQTVPSTTEPGTDTIVCHGNTRIIQQRTCTVDMVVSSNSPNFVTANIEKIEINQNVIDVNQDGHNLLVYYADFSSDHHGVTLQSILTEHIAKNGTGANYHTASLSDIRKLTIVWEGTSMTAADFTYLHSRNAEGTAYNFANLSELDLSEAKIVPSSGNVITIPAEAFKNMSALTKVALPNEVTEIGQSAFVGTSVKDLYLPASLTAVGTDALGSIRGIHITNPTTILPKTSSTEAKDDRRLFFVTEGLMTQYTKATSEGGGGYSATYCFKEATWLEDTDYYYRFVSGTDAELACYVGKPWTDEHNTLNINDTAVIRVGTKDYSVVNIDAYAFCNKIKANYATEPFTAQFSDKLNTIGKYAFYDCDGIGENIDLGGCKTVGYCAFAYSDGLKYVTGLQVESVAEWAFLADKALLVAKFPKGVMGLGALQGCDKLVVAECAASCDADAGFLQSDTNIKFVIPHNEVSTASVATGNSTAYLHGINTQSVFLISEKPTRATREDPTLQNYYTKFNYTLDFAHVLSGGNFDADEWVYISAADNSTTEVRYTYNVGTEEEPSYKCLSDLGYGDYVYGIRDDGNGGKEAVLLACLLQEIKGNYQVPNTITVINASGTNTYPVVEVNKRAFQRTKVQVENADAGTIATTLTFGNNMKAIGDQAFANLGFTGALDLKNVTSVGAKAFYKTNITSVSLGKVSTMGDYAFAESTALKSLEGDQATAIGQHSFQSCTKLLYAKGENIQLLGKYAFRCCSALLQATFPNARWEGYVFSDCSALVLLETTTTTTGSENSVIEKCTALKLWIVHPESLNAQEPTTKSFYTQVSNNSHVASYAANNNYAILFSQATDTCRAYYTAAITAGFTPPCSAYHIYTTGNFLPEDYAFTNGGTNTNYYTFADGSNMKRLSDLTDCDGRAYGDYVWGLDKVNHTATLLYSLVTAVGNSTNQTTYADLPEYVYRMEDDGSGNLTQVAYAVTTLQQNCFKNTSFTNCTLNIPDNLRTIESNVFVNRGIIGHLDLNNLTNLGTEAFKNVLITSVSLGKVNVGGGYSFYSCSNLKTVDCAEATIIGAAMFQGCKELVSVDFHGDDTLVTQIGAVAFSGCSKLQSIDARKVTTLSYGICQNCTSLTYVNLPELTYEDYQNFKGCTSLVTANLPKLTNVSWSTFEGCTSLKNVDITAATSIESSCFLNCSSLVGIQIPNVTTIGTSAFSGCSKLSEIEGLLVTNIKGNAFDGCIELRRAIFPNAKIVTKTFNGCSKLTVLETSIYENYAGAYNAVITGCTSLKYWYLNTESTNRTLSGHVQSTYCYASAGNKFLYNTTAANDNFVLLVSEKQYNGASGYTVIMGSGSTSEEDSASFNHVLSSQTFVPAEYVYVNASDTDTTVTRYSVTDAGGTKYYLSDLGAGDYVFGIKSNNQAVLLACLLKEIKAGYQVPDTVTVGGVTYPVTEINKRAFTRVNFLSGASVSFGDNLTTIGSRAFKGAAIEGTLNLNNVTTVGEYAFYKNKLTTLNLDAVTTAGDYAFADSPITTLSLGHLTTMGEHTLQNLSSLQTLNCDYAGIAEDNTTSFAWLTCSTVNCGHISRIGKNKFYRSGHAMGNPNLVTINMEYCPVVGEGAFYQCANVTTITATNVTEIEVSGFSECTGVTSIALPNVTDIGKYAFKKCTKLANVTFGSLETLDTGSFEDCTALTAIDLGDHIISIGDVLTFSGCTKLVSIDFGSLTQTYAYTCSGCTSLTTVIMPNVTKVGQCAFDGCTSLASIDLANVTSVGLEAFENCLLTTLHLGKVSYIGTDAFKGTTIENLYCDQCTLIEVDNFAEFTGKTSLETVDCGSVTRVGANVFKGCSGITSLTIGTACTEIGESAFQNCSRIPALDLKNVTTVGANAFNGCSTLATIDFGAVTTIGDYAFNGVAITEADLKNVETTGKACVGSAYLATVHLGKIETIDGYPFYGPITTVYCDSAPIIEDDLVALFAWKSGITSVDLGTVTKVGGAMFRGTGITSLDSKNVTEIGLNAFMNCASLVTADLSSVVTIAKNGFNSCSKLQSVTFRDIESIGEYAFSGDPKLLSVDFSGTPLNSLGQNVFDGCSAMTDIKFGDNLETIPAYCCQSCTALVNVDFGSVDTISTCAFAYDKNLDVIDFGSTVKNVGGDAFVGSKINTLKLGSCTNPCTFGSVNITNVYCGSAGHIDGAWGTFTNNTYIKYVNLGTQTTIGPSIFSGCTALETVDLTTVATIGDNAFKGCTALTTLTMNNVTSIGANAFDGDLNMAGSYDFSHVTSIGASAFNGCALLTGTVDLSACTTLGANAFTGTAISSVDMGSLLTTVGSSAFMNCVELETLNLGHVTELGSSAFKSCLKLSSAQSNYVTKVGTSCFYGCNNLISVLMPNLCDFSNGTTRDANGLDTFASCSNLAVIETAFPAFTGTETTFRLGGIFDGSTKLRVWIMHPENNTVSSNKTLKLCYASGTSAHAFSLFGSSWNNTVNSNFRIVIPQNGVATSSLFDNVNDVEILNTGTFMTFNWGNVTDHTGEGRLSYGLSNNKYLSDYGCGDYLYYVDTTTGKAVIVTALLDSLTGSAYTVPQTLYTDESDPTTALAVSGIGAMAYYHVDCASSLSLALTFGGSIASIGDSAFKDLAGITGITLGDSVLTIGNDAFNGTSIAGALDLNKVTTLGTGNFKTAAITSLDCGDNLTAIADECFRYCYSLTAVDFGNVQTIGDAAFSSCTALANIDFGNVTTIGAQSFNYCTAIITLDLKNVTSIGNQCFANCKNLATVHLGVLATAASTAFDSCPLTTLYCDSAPLISSDTTKYFNSNASITTVYCGSLTKVGDSAFYGCSNLATVDLESVTTISNSAFVGTKVTTIDAAFLKNVTTIGDSAFFVCTAITKVDLRNTQVTSVGIKAFQQCTALTEIHMGTLTSISNSMFRGCTTLATVDFENVTTLGDDVFVGCKHINDINLANITSIGSYCFSGAHTTRFHMGALSSIGASCFNNFSTDYLYCDNNALMSGNGYSPISDVKYVDCCQLTTLGSTKFYDASNLEAINFRNVTTISNNAFRNCKKLCYTLNDDETLTPGLDFKNVQTIGDSTFYGCTKLEAVNFRNVTSIGQSAFNGCTSLANTLNDDGTISAGLDFKNVTSLGWESFTGCTKLYYVVGNNVTACSRYVFSRCTKLVKAVLPKAKLGVQMFGGCTSLLVLECALASNQYPLSACTGLKLIVLHPESANSTSLSLFNNSPLNNYWDGDPFSTNYYVLCTNDVANNDVNYYDITTLSAGNFHIVPTGTYFPNQYVYGNASNSENVVRVTYTDENGATKYLSDLGYGDYVYGVDSMGNATMFACLLDEVTDSYTTPESVTVGSSTYYVKGIGERAYSQVDFTDGTLSVANGVTTLGRYAFGNPYNTARAADSYSITIPYSVTSIGTNAFDGFGSCVNLRLMGDSTSALDAPNVFGASPTLPDGFKIKVRKMMLPKYQNYTGDAWGGIATSHVYFEAMDIVYVDTTTNVTYYLANNGDNTYTLNDVELPSTFSATTLTLLSVYPGDGTLDGDLAGNVIAIGYNALAGIKTIAITSIILPDSLESLDNQNFIYPTALQSFTISASNPNYDTLDGVLYAEGKTVLLICPMAKTDTTFALPSEVIAIAPAAFKNVAALQTVTATAEGTFSGYLFVSEESFVNCEALTEVSFGRTAIMSNNVFTGCYALAHVHYLGAGTNLFLGSEPYGDRTVTETFGA